MSLVSYGDSSGSDSEGERTAVQLNGPKKSQDIRKLLSVLPAPVKGGKQRVQVVVPSLKQQRTGKGNGSDDSDSDEAPEPKRKTGGGGLTQLLPKPKQAVAVVGKAVKTAQPMIPYTLTKRPTPTTAKAKRKPKPTKPAARKPTQDSDSDEEPSSFFSLSERTDEPVATSILDSHTTEPSLGPSPMPHQHSTTEPLLGPSPMPHQHSTTEPSLGPSPIPSSTGPYADYGVGYYGPGSEAVDTAPSAPRPFTLGEEPTWSYHEPAQPAQETVTPTPDHQSAEGGAGPLLGVGPGLSMDEQAYRRLMGGKRKRGRDPSLNDLIEIKGDDVRDEIESYRKHHSEETVDNLYKPPEGEKPTGQQKRKHQLTYLAHEAKANELRLLKQWGASAATRRDTQMKYGF